MRKHIAKTISILSLFIALTVGASNVFAFPCNHCMPSLQYAKSAPAQAAGQATAQETESVAQPESSVGFITLLWMRLEVFFASWF